VGAIRPGYTTAPKRGGTGSKEKDEKRRKDKRPDAEKWGRGQKMEKVPPGFPWVVEKVKRAAKGNLGLGKPEKVN